MLQAIWFNFVFLFFPTILYSEDRVHSTNRLVVSNITIFVQLPTTPITRIRLKRDHVETMSQRSNTTMEFLFPYVTRHRELRFADRQEVKPICRGGNSLGIISSFSLTLWVNPFRIDISRLLRTMDNGASKN